MMKNIEASVGAVPAQKKKEVEKKTAEKEEEEYHQMKNEMVFYLNKAPEYQISAVGEWCENARGDIVQEADTYFLHIMTGQRCDSVWGCLVGWSEPNENSTEKWETLCRRIEEHGNIEGNICDEKRVGV